MPTVFHSEIAYKLVKIGRSKNLKLTTIEEWAEMILSKISFTTHVRGDALTIMRNAARFHTSGYDVQYLVLAMQKQAAIATLDKGLIAACKRQNVPIWQAG